MFFKFTYPAYETDYEHDRANPAQVIKEVSLPGQICPVCGVWSGSRRIYLTITDTKLCDQLSVGPLPLPQWIELAEKVRVATGLPKDFELKPGDVLGNPKIVLQHIDVPDFLHLFPGQIIVKGVVLESLQRINCSGFRAVRAEVHYSKDLELPLQEPPEIYELVVTGSAWREGMDKDKIVVCDVCGRTKFLYPEWLAVDQDTWDGSDFFHLDMNPNIVIVTERVCAIFQEHRFTNYACKPIS